MNAACDACVCAVYEGSVTYVHLHCIRIRVYVLYVYIHACDGSIHRLIAFNLSLLGCLIHPMKGRAREGVTVFLHTGRGMSE